MEKTSGEIVGLGKERNESLRLSGSAAMKFVLTVVSPQRFGCNEIYKVRKRAAED